jgi:hypothetical protein
MQTGKGKMHANLQVIVANLFVCVKSTGIKICKAGESRGLIHYKLSGLSRDFLGRYCCSDHPVPLDNLTILQGTLKRPVSGGQNAEKSRIFNL